MEAPHPQGPGQSEEHNGQAGRDDSDHSDSIWSLAPSLCVFLAHLHQKRRLASGKRGNALLEMVSTSRHTDNEIPSAKDTGPPLESSIETHTEPPNRS